MKWVITIVPVFVFILSACKTSTEPETKVEATAKDTLIFKYDSLASFPYSQSIMVTGYADRIFIYGAYGKYSVYYTENKTLVNFSTVNDTMSWRWDGAFVTVDSTMYIFANGNGTGADYRKVLTFNPITYQIASSAAVNPFTRHLYPACAAVGNNILILYPLHDSLYVFSTGTMTGQFVSQNKLKHQFNGKEYSSGVYGDGFYIYDKTVKQLFKINTMTYVWEEIVIPDSIKSKIDPYAFGGVIGNTLCLFNQRNSSGATVAYNMATQKWLVSPSNTIVDIGEPYFYTSNNALYMAEVFSQKLWKISLVN